MTQQHLHLHLTSTITTTTRTSGISPAMDDDYIEETINLEPHSPTAHDALQLRITTDTVLSAGATDRPEPQTLHASLAGATSSWMPRNSFSPVTRTLVIALLPLWSVLRSMKSRREIKRSASSSGNLLLSLARQIRLGRHGDAKKLAENTRQFDPAQLAF